MRKFLSGLQEALEHSGGTHTLKDVADQITRGAAQVWVNDDACIVTEVHDFPRQRVLHFWLATGDLHAILALQNDVLEWGKKNGCAAASLAGRRGWERVLADEGWTPTVTYMRREMPE
jgi:hypothetical protein